MNIAPGSTVSIEIAVAPKNAAACKTLTRICAKDAAVGRARRWRKTHRPSRETWRRGGKMWHHQMKSRLPVNIAPGAKYTVQATLDVIRDLQSVARYVTVLPR
jgi:hypothetical protein